MTVRTVIREVREYPATALFSMAWILVFAAMAVLWLRTDPSRNPWRILVLGIGEGHRFGDLSLAELRQGQVWRLVTCNFVHYSLIHIALNLLAFYLLGTLVESWYGAPQFAALYLILGAGGNLISMLIRVWLKSNPAVHSGGGSVVVMGLIGLCAVVGWRSRTELGSDLGWQMTKALAMTGLLGVAFPRYIDNWGHAGGVFVGLGLGLTHRWMLRRHGRPSAWTLGLVAGVAIAASGAAQLAADRREASGLVELKSYHERMMYDGASRSLNVAAMLGEKEVDARVVIQTLKTDATLLDSGSTRGAYRRGLALASDAMVRALSDEEQGEFDRCLGQLASELLAGFAPLLKQGPEPAALERLSMLAAAARTRHLTDAEKAEFKERLSPLRAFVRGELTPRMRDYWRLHRERDRARARPG